MHNYEVRSEDARRNSIERGDLPNNIIEIHDGPSREALFDALRLSSELRTVTFDTSEALYESTIRELAVALVDDGGSHVTTPPSNLWEGVGVFRDSVFSFRFNTATRQGWLQFK